jgi:PAS domain-containing protein
VNDEQGRLRGFARITRDGTERKLVEDALPEAESFSRATLDSVTAHICVLDDKGTILAVNRAWQDFAALGPPPPKNLSKGSNYLEACDSAQGNGAKQARALAEGVRAILRGERKKYSLVYACHSPTKQRWSFAKLTRFIQDGPARVVIAEENITNRKLNEDRLLSHARLSEATLNQASEAFFLLTVGGNVIHMNSFTRSLRAFC